MTSYQITGGSLLMDCLIALGSSKGFGVPGESYLAVLEKYKTMINTNRKI